MGVSKACEDEAVRGCDVKDKLSVNSRQRSPFLYCKVEDHYNG